MISFNSFIEGPFTVFGNVGRSIAQKDRKTEKVVDKENIHDSGKDLKKRKRNYSMYVVKLYRRNGKVMKRSTVELIKCKRRGKKRKKRTKDPPPVSNTLRMRRICVRLEVDFPVLTNSIQYGVGSPKFIWAPCVQLYSLAETPQLPPSPRIWAHIRGRY